MSCTGTQIHTDEALSAATITEANYFPGVASWRSSFDNLRHSIRINKLSLFKFLFVHLIHERTKSDFFHCIVFSTASHDQPCSIRFCPYRLSVFISRWSHFWCSNSCRTPHMVAIRTILCRLYRRSIPNRVWTSASRKIFQIAGWKSKQQSAHLIRMVITWQEPSVQDRESSGSVGFSSWRQASHLLYP